MKKPQYKDTVVCPDLSRVKVLNSVIGLPIKINCWRISLLLKIKLFLFVVMEYY